MADSTLPLIQALLGKLKEDSSLTPLLEERVYTALPENVSFPCAQIDIASAPFETMTSQGMNHEVRIMVFSRAHGAKEALELRGLMHDALHNGNLSITGFSMINMRSVGPNRTQLMRDGATWRSTIRLSIKVSDLIQKH